MLYPYKSFREWFGDEEKLGNVVRIETPIKCGDYNNIVDIGNGIPGKIPETEMRALVRYLHSLPGKPMGFIEKPVNNRPDIPVIVNPWPGRERVLRGMGLSNKEEFCKKMEGISTNRIKPIKVPKADAPCKEVIIPEEKVDLRRDIARCWVEFNQLLWSGCNGTIIVYDPETGAHHLGKLRAGQYEWEDANPDKPHPEERVKKYMIATMPLPRIPQSDTGWYYYNNYAAKNRPMPAAYAFGLPTDVHMMAALRRLYTGRRLRWPETGDEYEVLGGFRGQPVEVVESETIPGLMVPAQAEWVIEGEFVPNDFFTTPPCGEDMYMGYMFGGISWPVFRVKCITHRKQPWWTATTFSSNGMHGHEGTHSGLVLLKVEVDAIMELRGLGYKVKDVVTNAYDMTVDIIQLEVDGSDKVEHYGKRVGMTRAASEISREWPKYVIVVGPDIDPYDLTDVMWAVGTRAMPISDSITIPKGPAYADAGALLAAQGMDVTRSGEQVVIDALMKVPERYGAYPPRTDPVEWEKEAIKRMKEKLGSA